MERKTLIAIGAFIAIAVGAWLTMRAPEKGQRVGAPPRPIAAFKAAEVKELEFTGNGSKVAFKLTDRWRMTSPGQHSADQGLLKTALDQLEKISFGDLVTESPPRFADLETNDEKGTRVVAKDGAGKVLFDAHLGKTSNGFTMVKPAGKNEVWQAAGLFKYTYTRETKLWRDHAVLELNKDDASRITVETGGQKIVLDKVPPAADKTAKPDPNAEAKWRVVESAVKVEPIDDAAANALVAAFTSLRASDFADDAKPADTGLSPPSARVTVAIKGAPITLLLGKAKGEDSYAQVEGQPALYLLQKYQVEKLAVRPINFRDKTLLKVKEDDLVELAVTVDGETLVLKREGAVWKSAQKGAKEFDDQKVKPMVTSFEKLEASGYAETSDPKTTGLGKPGLQAVLKLRDKSQITLKFGAIKDGTDYFVQKSGLADVVLLKKYLADRFLRKAADLAKSDAPPSAGAPPGMPMGFPQGHP